MKLILSLLAVTFVSLAVSACQSHDQHQIPPIEWGNDGG
jgi:hypothetical protein